MSLGLAAFQSQHLRGSSSAPNWASPQHISLKWSHTCYRHSSRRSLLVSLSQELAQHSTLVKSNQNMLHDCCPISGNSGFSKSLLKRSEIEGQEAEFSGNLTHGHNGSQSGRKPEISFIQLNEVWRNPPKQRLSIMYGWERERERDKGHLREPRESLIVYCKGTFTWCTLENSNRRTISNNRRYSS